MEAFARMKYLSRWPKRPVTWVEDGMLYISVPFTWNMPRVRHDIRGTGYKKVVLGGPGVYLVQHFYPDYLAGMGNVEVHYNYPGILQRINPQATRTTTGCSLHCKFCGIGAGVVEPGGLRELENWPDLPVLTDNNLLAASQSHFDKVIDRLKCHDFADFEQGLDPRLLTSYHAGRIAEVKHAIIRLAIDSQSEQESWLEAVDRLLSAGVAKYRVRSYALIGFNTDPGEAWARCQWIEARGIGALPMWFHQLDALEHNVVTEEQEKLGWDDFERRRIMQWFYHHKKAVC